MSSVIHIYGHVFGDVNVQPQSTFIHLTHNPVNNPQGHPPAAFTGVNNALVPQVPLPAAAPENPQGHPPAAAPDINNALVPQVLPAAAPENPQGQPPAAVTNVNNALVPVQVPDPAAAPNVANNNLIEIDNHDAPEAPLPALRRLRMRTSPFLCNNISFWQKIATLPDHLCFVFLARINVWDHPVTREILRLVIQHFRPEIFVPQRTSKAQFVRLFHRDVLAFYGARYRNAFLNVQLI